MIAQVRVGQIVDQSVDSPFEAVALHSLQVAVFVVFQITYRVVFSAYPGIYSRFQAIGGIVAILVAALLLGSLPFGRQGPGLFERKCSGMSVL
jgi:hypothetical protein